jgi:hypothetical protein
MLEMGHFSQVQNNLAQARFFTKNLAQASIHVKSGKISLATRSSEAQAR